MNKIQYNKEYFKKNKDTILARYRYRYKHDKEYKNKSRQKYIKYRDLGISQIWSKKSYYKNHKENKIKINANHRKRRLENKTKHRDKIRTLTYKIYGKTPKGYQFHHLDYKSPHNFIIVSIKEHRLIHRKY